MAKTRPIYQDTKDTNLTLYETVMPDGKIIHEFTLDGNQISELNGAYSKATTKEIIYFLRNPESYNPNYTGSPVYLSIKTRRSSKDNSINFKYVVPYTDIDEYAIAKIVDFLVINKYSPKTLSTSTPTQNVVHSSLFGVGTKFRSNIRPLITYTVSKIENGRVFVSWFDTYTLSKSEVMNFDYESISQFENLVKGGDLILFKDRDEIEILEEINNKFFYDEKGNLCIITFVAGDARKTMYDFAGREIIIDYESKYFPLQLFDSLFQNGFWNKLYIEEGDVFISRVGTSSSPYKNFKINEFIQEPLSTTIQSTIVFKYGHEESNLSNLKNFLRLLLQNNAERIPAPKQTISNPSGVTYERIKDLKKEIGDLVSLREIISEVDFEDRVNVNTMIQQSQKEIDKLNSLMLEEKLGSDSFFDSLFDQSFTPLRNRYDNLIFENKSIELLAPNGKKSELNDNLQSIINSSWFVEWFGDWRSAYNYRNLKDFGGENVSKVLSENFEPLLVWHGTGKEFSYFKFDQFPANYFAVNRSYAEFFAAMHSPDGIGYIIPFFLNIKNPLDLTIFGNEEVSATEFFDWLYLQTGMNAEELGANLLLLEAGTPPLPVWVYIRNSPKMLVKISQSTNFDGIMFDEFNPNIKDKNNPAYSTRAYIVFEPNQVKIADPERGEILLTSLKSFILEKGGKI
jgi:hypothetical protein